MEDLREKAIKKLEQLITDKYYKQTEIAAKMGITYVTLYNRRKNKYLTGKEINIVLNEL